MLDKEKQLKQELAKYDDEYLCISNENLCGSIVDPSGEQTVKIANLIHRIVGETKIIIVLRHPLDYMKSTYSHRSRMGALQSSPHHYQQYLADPDVAKGYIDKLNYQKLIGVYIERFDSSNVLVLPYELFFDDPVQYTNYICDFAGVDRYNIGENVVRSVNSSPTILATRLFAFANSVDSIVNSDRSKLGIVNKIVWKLNDSSLLRPCLSRLPKFQRPILADLPSIYRDLLQNGNYRIWEGKLSYYNYTFD
jgi:hypothetical protein